MHINIYIWRLFCPQRPRKRCSREKTTLVTSRCMYLRDDDFFYLCGGQDFGAFTWGVTISVHSCVRGRIWLHLPLTHECTEIIMPHMHQNPALHTRMHWIRHSSGKWTEIPPLAHDCTKILPLTYECTEFIILQVNAPESYSSHINAPKSSLLRWMHWNPTPHTWMHRNHHPSSKCTEILPITHECTDIVTG